LACDRNGHMMTHSSKKPFECKFIGCAKSYCDARSLRRHLENHHQDYISTTAAFDSANCLVDGGSVELSATASDTSLHGIPADTQFNASSVWTTGYNPLECVSLYFIFVPLSQELGCSLNTIIQYGAKKCSFLSCSAALVCNLAIGCMCVHRPIVTRW